MEGVKNMESFSSCNNINLLPLYVIRTGFKALQNHVYRNQGYPAYQLSVCTGGTGEFNCMGNTHTIQRGDIFIFAPRVPHEYYPLGQEWNIHFFAFNGDGVSNIMQYMNVDGCGVYSMNETELQGFADKMQKLHEEFKRDAGMKSSAMMFCMLSEIYRLKRKKPIINLKNDENHERIITPVIRYMRERYKECVSLDDICELTGVSKSYLCRIFKKKTGISPIRYLMNIRVEEAKKLLVSTDMRIVYIAEETGFNDISYFCAVFRGNVGLTPDEYRRVQKD